MIDPWRTNTLLDSCAFDPKYEPEQTAAEELFRLHEEKELPLLIAHSTQKEIDHPNTPPWVKREAASKIFSVNVQKTSNELRLRQELLTIIAGKAAPKKYVADVEHIFEAQKYGSYFVTADRRLLKHAEEIRSRCGVIILLPSQLLALVRMRKN